jgi:hypothetical protein
MIEKMEALTWSNLSLGIFMDGKTHKDNNEIVLYE